MGIVKDLFLLAYFFLAGFGGIVLFDQLTGDDPRFALCMVVKNEEERDEVLRTWYGIEEEEDAR